MKKKLTLSILAAMALNAHAQVKKVLLEDYTGTWCGWCPEGAVVVEELLAAHPTNFIAVASHSGDQLAITDGTNVQDGVGVTGFPQGAVDRFLFTGQSSIAVDRHDWADLFTTRAAVPAKASVSFTNAQKVGSNYNVTVNVKFTSSPSAGIAIPIKMNVYILEDSIPAVGIYQQENYSSEIQGGASPLSNWFLNGTLRKALGGTWGYSNMIPQTVVVGTNYTQNISFSLDSTWTAKHINIVAFVAYDGPAENNQKEIINAEQMPLKNFAGVTAIRDVKSNLQTNVYPNPASTRGYIKASFNLKEDAMVSMQVVNVLGQVVSKPYNSFEIKGTHTIQWSPLENAAIVPGVYFLQLNTDKGDSQTTRLVLQ